MLIKKIISIHCEPMVWDPKVRLFAEFCAQIPTSVAKHFLATVGILSIENIIDVFWGKSEPGELNIHRLTVQIPPRSDDPRQALDPIAFLSTVFSPNNGLLQIGLIVEESHDIVALIEFMPSGKIGQKCISLLPYLVSLDELNRSIQNKTPTSHHALIKELSARESELAGVLRVVPGVQLINSKPFIQITYTNGWNVPVLIRGLSFSDLELAIEGLGSESVVLWAGPTIYQTGHYHQSLESVFKTTFGTDCFVSPFLSSMPAVDSFSLLAFLAADASLNPKSIIETCAGSGAIACILAGYRRHQGRQLHELISTFEINPWATVFIQKNIAQVFSGRQVSEARTGIGASPSEKAPLIIANAPAFMDLRHTELTPSASYSEFWDCGVAGSTFFFELVRHLDQVEFKSLVVWNHIFFETGDPALYVLSLHPGLNLSVEYRRNITHSRNTQIATYWISPKTKDEFGDLISETDDFGHEIPSRVIQKIILGLYPTSPEFDDRLTTCLMPPTQLSETDIARLALALYLGKLAPFPRLTQAVQQLADRLCQNPVAFIFFRWAILDGKFPSDSGVPEFKSSVLISRRPKEIADSGFGSAEVRSKMIGIGVNSIWSDPFMDQKYILEIPNSPLTHEFDRLRTCPYSSHLPLFARLVVSTAKIWDNTGQISPFESDLTNFQNNPNDLPHAVSILVQHARDPVSLEAFLSLISTFPNIFKTVASKFIKLYLATSEPAYCPDLSVFLVLEAGTTLKEVPTPSSQRLDSFQITPIFAHFPTKSSPAVTLLIEDTETRKSNPIQLRLCDLIVAKSGVHNVYVAVAEQILTAMAKLNRSAMMRIKPTLINEEWIRDLLNFVEISRNPTAMSPPSRPLKVNSLYNWPLKSGESYQKGLVSVYDSSTSYANHLEFDDQSNVVVYASCGNDTTTSARLQKMVFPAKTIKCVTSLGKIKTNPSVILNYLTDLFLVQVVVAHSELLGASTLADPMKMGAPSNNGNVALSRK